MGMMMPYFQGMGFRDKDIMILESERLMKLFAVLYGGAYWVHGGGFTGAIHINDYLSNGSV